jgi:hypothetical protein
MNIFPHGRSLLFKDTIAKIQKKVESFQTLSLFYVQQTFPVSHPDNVISRHIS